MPRGLCIRAGQLAGEKARDAGANRSRLVRTIEEIDDRGKI